MGWKRENEYVKFLNGEIIKGTSAAILFQSDFMEKQIWLPRSQISIELEDEGSSTGRATVGLTKWILDRKEEEEEEEIK